jgi:serine/threonine protein phosphatase PrpC
MEQVELRYGIRTDVGRVREVNEDDLLAAPPVFAVADGMGGHDGGDVASRFAVEELRRLAEDGYDPAAADAAVVEALARAQQRIADYAADRRAEGFRSSPGTTAVAALLVESEAGPAWLVANLGDSRCYRLSHGILDQVSADHSLVQHLVDSGQITPAEAATHPERHVVTRALGGPEPPRPDLFLLPLDEAPRLLLCSDGVSGMIDDSLVAAVLRDFADPSEAADRLVDEALHAGGRDNATAVVVDVVGGLT